MASLACFSTGSTIGSDKWKIEPACTCVRCVQFRDTHQTNHDASSKRQYIALKFETDLPLKQREVHEAIRLLESMLDVLRKATEEPPAAGAVDPVGELAEPDPTPREKSS